MKREGRQHGMVRAYEIMPSPWNPRPSNSKIVNRFESRSTAGLFTRVQSKPTNHSKFTSKCGRRARCSGCHDSPTSKAKDKVKGNQKIRASDLTMNHRLVAWKIGNGGRGFDFTGASATAILGHLSNDYDEFYDDDDDEEEEDVVDDDLNYGLDEFAVTSAQEPQEEEFAAAEVEIEEHQEDVNGEDEDDDAMSFCDVGFVMDDQIDGDEEWCIVEEL